MRRAAVAIVLFTVGCGDAAAPLKRSLSADTTHAQYASALTEIGFDQVALGRDWIEAAARALAQPVPVALPFAESGYLGPDQPAAVGFRFDLQRGRRLAIDVSFESSQPARLFVDLFELRDGEPPRRVGGLDPGQRVFEHDVRWSGAHVLRLQPELLRGGRYSVSQRTLASLRPPVKGFTVAGVRSGFGAPRDGGTRDHHGIDIFRPRGTPVLAAADGYARLSETPRGGRVVWLRDARTGRSLYYAHLHDWAIESGVEVKVGDVLGYVGNTGNATTTPPHLHFGVYERGPTDPLPYLQRDDPAPAKVTASLESLGSWMRVRSARRTRGRSVSEATAATTISPGTAVRVLAATGDSYRVELPDGSQSLFRTRDLVPGSSPLRTAAISGPVRELARLDAPVIAVVNREMNMAVLGEFAGFHLVRLPDNRLGWHRRN